MNRLLTSFAAAALLLASGGFNALCAESSAAAPVKSTGPTHPLDESELNTMLAEVLQRDYVKDKGTLELRFTRAWTPVAVPDEALDLRVLDLPTAGVTSHFIVRFQIASRRETLGNWQMPVHAQIWRETPVARITLKRGQVLTSSDFTTQRRDMLTMRDTPWDAVLAGVALEMAENITAGNVLYARSIGFRPVVRRGQCVQALVQDGAMFIGMKVEVLEDGVPGQIVRVRNTQSLRELRGKVQNEKTIQLTL